MGPANALAALMMFLLLAMPLTNVGLVLQAQGSSTSDMASGDTGLVKIWFRPEGPMWYNESYSIWPANTSYPTGQGILWTFRCTGGPYEYGGLTFYTGGIGWVLGPLAGDVEVSGDVEVVVWLNSTDRLGFLDQLAYGVVLADVDEEGELVDYWYDYKSGRLPGAPNRMNFRLENVSHVFQEGHYISIGVGVATTKYGYRVSSGFGGEPYLAHAELPVVDHLRIEGVAILGPDGSNRTEFILGESPITFNISVSDPLGNLDVAEVRVSVFNATHVLFNRTAEAITNRTAFTAWYVATWEPEGLALGNYTVEVRARDNSGNTAHREVGLEFVVVRIGNWSYAPSSIKIGMEGRLEFSFTNLGLSRLKCLRTKRLHPHS